MKNELSSGERGHLSQLTMWAMALFTALFVLIEVVVFAGVFYTLVRNASTIHVVTDHRILNVHGGPWPGCHRYDGRQRHIIRRIERGGRRGPFEIAYCTGRDTDDEPIKLTAEWRQIPDAHVADAAIRAVMVAAARP